MESGMKNDHVDLEVADRKKNYSVLSRNGTCIFEVVDKNHSLRFP